MKKLTVLTITHNRSQYNIPSIQSILSQTYQDFQYLVVNDGSTDNTQDILDSIKHPNLTVIHQENKGFTNTLVDILPEIDTPYVALNGAGDISHPERLEKQIELLESDELIGAVGCHVRKVTHDRKIIKKWIDPVPVISDVRKLFKFNYFTHGEVMFRYSAYNRAGGYRRFFKYAQDKDLWLRMIEFSKLAKVDSILYDQVFIPNTSVGCDYQKVEIQAKLSSFAEYLAKQRLDGKPDELDQQGDQYFQHFCNHLSQEDKSFISERIITTVEKNYFQTANHQILIDAARRALEINPKNHSSKKYLKLANLTSTLNWLGFKEIAKDLNDGNSQLTKKLRNIRKTILPTSK